tara:strand:+ start:532 stop:732 length:201 start_codon:yes stop_codon:yes gene_type:complete
MDGTGHNYGINSELPILSFFEASQKKNRNQVQMIDFGKAIEGFSWIIFRALLVKVTVSGRGLFGGL